MEQYLGELVTVMIDRPIGSSNYELGYVYPVNYGYIPQITTSDGKQVEAYLLGEFEAVTSCKAYVSGIVEADDSDRLILCKEEDMYTKEQMESLVEFHERFFDSDITTYEDELEDEEDSSLNYLMFAMLAVSIAKPDQIRIVLILLLIQMAAPEFIKSEKPKALLEVGMKMIAVIVILVTALSYIPGLLVG